jgi:ribA/ribD-fused uncharacterized protein
MITQFNGIYRWLSNFWPCDVILEGVIYPSVENAYQAAKTNNLAERAVFETCSAVEAKWYGRRLTMRPDWNEIKLEMMTALCRQKFQQEPFKSKLLATQDWIIREGNWWGDTYWGICRGEGQNHLGKIIMRLRTELR